MTAPSTYAPAPAFWPGSFVLTAGGENAGWQYGSKLYTDVLAYNTIPIISTPAPVGGPSVYAQDCSGGPVIGSPLWMSCLAADPKGGNNNNDGPMVLQNGIAADAFLPTNPMGRIILEGSGTTQPQDFITFYDSATDASQRPLNGANLFSQPGQRPKAQLGDCAISADGATPSANNGLALRCQHTISSYIGTMPDGSSWGEQLSGPPFPAQKSFTVPLVLSNGTQSPNNTFTVTPATLTTARVLAIPDPGGPASFGLSLGLTTITGPTSVLANTCFTSPAASIPNVTSANTLIVTPQSSLSSAGYKGMSVDAYVSSTGTVKLEVCNSTASNISPSAVVFNVRAF